MRTSQDTSTQVALLAAATRVTEGVVAGVSANQADDPTPCPKFDVTAMVDHLVGYATSFADRASGVSPAADPGTVTAGPQPGRTYHQQAVRLVDGYGGDGPADGAVPIGVALIETVIHGWDLATATGQAAPYPDDAVAAALDAAHGMMKPEYRGDGMTFGQEVEVPASAPALDRLVGFMGRDPGWRSPA